MTEPATPSPSDTPVTPRNEDDAARDDSVPADPTAADASEGEGEDEGDVRVVDRRWWARSEESSATPDGRSNKPSYVEDLEKQLADKDALLRDYAAKYRAAANEFDQTRDRLRKTVAKDIDREKRKLLADFLEVVDNLDRALLASADATTDSPEVRSLREGVELVRQQFLATLGTHGVTTIEADGEPFDPNLHEAISIVPVNDAGREDVVMEVVKPGYRVDDDVLRPASVTVGKLAPEPE